MVDSGKAALKFVEDYNTVVENAIRLSAFRTAVEAGQTEAKAASIAKELTVNFNRKGELGRGLNNAYLFYNASTQGIARMMVTLLRGDKGLWAMVGSVTALGAGLEIFNHMVDDDDAYERISDSVKDRNFIIMDPLFSDDGYIKIPMAYGFSLFPVIGQELARIGLHQAGAVKEYSAGKSAMRIAMTTIDSFNPVGSGAPAQTIAPTLIDPFAKMWENKDWHGGPLLPDHNERQADHLKHFANARKPSVEATRLLAELTKDDKTLQSAIYVSPETIDMWVDMLTGSAGKFLADTALLPYNLAAGNEVELKQVPLLRKVYGTVGKSDLQRSFYERYNDVQTTVQAYDDLPNEEKRPVREKMIGEGALVILTRNTRKQLGKLSRAKKTARRINDKAKLKDIEDRKLEVMERWLDRYRTVMLAEQEKPNK